MAQSWTFCLVYYAGLSWLALALVLSSRIGMGRPGVILASPRWFAQQFHMLPWSIWWMNPSLQLGASALAFPFLSSAMVGECWFHHREAGLGSSWVAITCSVRGPLIHISHHCRVHLDRILLSSDGVSLYRVTARDSYSRCNISLMIHLPMTKKPIYVLSDVSKYWLEDDGNMCLDETHRWRSAGAIAWLRTYGLQSVSNSIKAEIGDLVYNRIRGRASYDPPPGLWQYVADVS